MPSKERDNKPDWHAVRMNLRPWLGKRASCNTYTSSDNVQLRHEQIKRARGRTDLRSQHINATSEPTGARASRKKTCL